MPSTALLIRWSGGWHERVRSSAVAIYGRREALLGLGAASSVAEVDRVADSQLDIYADVREAIAVDLLPINNSDTPYLAFRVGDKVHVPDRAGVVAPQRVLSLTVSEDENGVITYAPELKDILLESDERQQQAIDKMVNGTMGGDSKVATPAAYISSQSDCCAPVPEGGGG